MAQNNDIQEMIDKRQSDIEAVNKAIEAIEDAVIVNNPSYDDLRTAYKALHAAKVSMQLQFDIDKKAIEFHEAHPTTTEWRGGNWFPPNYGELPVYKPGSEKG